MGLDYIARDPQQKAVNISAYDEQFIVGKLDVIKKKRETLLIKCGELHRFCGAKSTYRTSLKYFEFQ